jgi:hypothetical protein
MKKKTLTRAVLGACLLQLAALPVSFAANDWAPQLLPVKGARGPVEPIRIRLPKLPNAVLERLTLEFDDFDVTALVTRDGADAVFTPPQPLPYGPHQLRLVEYAADGAVIERGAWNIEIRKSSAFREGTLRVGSTLNLVQRIADDDLPANAPDKTQGNGAAQLYGVLADEGWRVQGNMDVFYNSQKILLPRNKNQVDIGQFLVRGDAGPVTAAAGHHTVAPDSLVMQAFNRRGISLGVGRDNHPASGTVFSLRTQDITGTQEGLGIGDDNNRVDGVNIIGRPLGDALTLSATYLDGEGPTFTGGVGTGIVGSTFSTGGHAASLVADGNLLNKSVRLRGEYATSRYDFDGIDTGNSAEKDDAYTALATYAPLQNTAVNGMPMALQLGIENKRIGTFFRSPANPIGVSDRDATRGFTGFNWGGLNVQASLGQESDNVNDLAPMPRTEMTQGVISVTWLPTLKLAPAGAGQAPVLPWHGQPMFNLTWVDLDQEVVKATAGLNAGALHATRNLSASMNFSYPTWMWSLIHSVGKDDDFTNLVDDTRSKLTQISLNARIGDKLTVGPAAQWSEIDNQNTAFNRDSETLTGLFNLGYAFTQRLNANLGYSTHRQKIDDNSIDTRSRDIIGNINWLVYPAQGMQPGLTLSLDGQHHDVDDRVVTTNNRNTYQIFLKASLTWLPTF